MDHTSHTDGSGNGVMTHKLEQFNANVPGGADFIVQSSDGVVFHIHRKNLELYTDGAFPGLHDSVNGSTAAGQIVRLDESSGVLEIVFQFIYPRRQPSLKGVGFHTILAVADAVEKYKIFAAMNLCEEALIDYLEDQPMPIFHHALQHRRVNLVNQSSMYLSRKPLLSVLDHIPPTLTMPWLRYLEAWKDMFKAQMKQLEGIKIDGVSCKFSSDSSQLCRPCLYLMVAWVNFLERMDKLSDLKAALTATTKSKEPSHTYAFNIGDPIGSSTGNMILLTSPFQSGFCPPCSKAKRCDAMEGTAKRILKNIEKLPPFTSFLNEDLDGEVVVANE